MCFKLQHLTFYHPGLNCDNQEKEKLVNSTEMMLLVYINSQDLEFRNKISTFEGLIVICFFHLQYPLNLKDYLEPSWNLMEIHLNIFIFIIFIFIRIHFKSMITCEPYTWNI